MERGPATPSRREKDDAPSKKTGSRNRGSRFYLRAATVLLLVSLLVSSGIYAIAKFTNSLQAQRTVAAYDTLGERFSSNYLQKGTGFNVRSVTVASDSETPLAIVTVCNYEQGRQMYVNPLDVPYALTMRLVRYDPVQGRYVAATAGDVGGYGISVEKGGTTVVFNGEKLSDSTTFSATLPSSSATTDAYTVIFTPYQNEIFLEITATPDPSTHLSSLHAILKAAIRMAGASSSWEGSFMDSTANAPASYDGFNYRVSGVGSGRFTLRWDPAKVGISAVSLLALLDIEGATQVGNSISFPVDAGVEALYDVQFYKVNITNETWSDMTNSVVTFDFSE